MKLRWSAKARIDLEEIGDYIARDDPRAARLFVAKIIKRAKQAGRFPRSGRTVPETDDEAVRELVLGAYRIIYRVESPYVSVLTVLEGHRLLKADMLTED